MVMQRNKINKRRKEKKPKAVLTETCEYTAPLVKASAETKSKAVAEIKPKIDAVI